MITLHHEAPVLAPQIEALLDRAFGPNRTAKISYRYRDGVAPIDALCFTAMDDNTLVGTVRHWPLELHAGSGSDLKAVLLGPIAVDPALKAKGIGARLMNHAISEARKAGVDIIVLVGDPAYYQRFGFELASTFGLVIPDENPARVQALPLTLRARVAKNAGIVMPVSGLVLSNAA